MSRFSCGVCREEIPLNDGFLSWQREDGMLKNFQITCRNCSEPTNNACLTLYEVMREDGFMNFVSYLLDRWEEGYVLVGRESLARVMDQISAHRCRVKTELLHTKSRF